MSSFLAANGYDPGPSQQPLLAGAICGVLATIPAVAILLAFGALEVEASILGLSVWATVAAGCILMAVAGALYAQLFGRAANDIRGGWLFGMSFSFALWAAGAVLILPLVSGGRTPAGREAVGVALSMLAWGLAIGVLVPFVHRPFHESLEKASRRHELGPDAATGKGRPIRQERPETG